MTGILDKFYVEHGIHGARVMAHSHQLTSNCLEDGEIDTAVQMLKDDLDACAKEMKRLVAVESSRGVVRGLAGGRLKARALDAKTASTRPRRARRPASAG